jgi:RimJ/RimL family protein N-acetyltransferase
MADEGFTELEGERVTLRRFRPADIEPFVAYRSDPDVARYQSWDAPYPLADGDRLVMAMRRQHPDTPGQWFQFAVTLRSTGELIGDCGTKPDAADPRQAEIGYTIAKPQHGRGYGTDTVRTLLGYLFGARGKHRVTASCDPRNTGSIRLLERVGMRREGHLRESAWFNGEWADDLLFAMLDREWAERGAIGSAAHAQVASETLVDLLRGQPEVGQ